MSLSWTAKKDPDEIKDYQINWSALLAGDTIATSAWTVPAGVTKDTDTNTTTTTTIWFSGGTAGETYPCLNRITTAGGRSYDRTVKLKMKSL